MTDTVVAHVKRVGRFAADPSRVVTRLFVPGQEGFEEQESRASVVLRRILALDEDEAELAFADVVARCSSRHHDLLATFASNFEVVADRVEPGRTLSDMRRLLVGAAFTCEFAVEGAAVSNPSVVLHPDQSGVAAGDVRVVMSVRAVGEGHRSSIGFRTAVFGAAGDIAFDAPPKFAVIGSTEPAMLDAAVFRAKFKQLRIGGENVDYVLAPLGERFTETDLEKQLQRLHGRLATRRHGGRTISVMRAIANRSYGINFSDSVPLPERVLWPAMDAECNGMEDARFVRFVEDDGTVRYYATYTAYDGREIRQQLLETTDFGAFTSSPLVGSAAANKGLSLFPRRIGGRYAALSRFDRENNAISFSDNPRVWEAPIRCHGPERAWEILQVGNCGSPIETDEGWLVLTHGVGPMRAYSIGAILLDLDDPTQVIGRLREPLLTTTREEQDGYVPNVVYSCGGLVHAGTLVVPYGIGDASIGIATVPLDALVGALGA